MPNASFEAEYLEKHTLLQQSIDHAFNKSVLRIQMESSQNIEDKYLTQSKINRIQHIFYNTVVEASCFFLGKQENVYNIRMDFIKQATLKFVPLEPLYEAQTSEMKMKMFIIHEGIRFLYTEFNLQEGNCCYILVY